MRHPRSTSHSASLVVALAGTALLAGCAPPDRPLTAVAERDDARVERIVAGDAEGFWGLVMEGGDDDLKWCGSSPIYTFLRAVPQARGQRLGYEQWNIDDESVVSFGALAFFDEK